MSAPQHLLDEAELKLEEIYNRRWDSPYLSLELFTGEPIVKIDGRVTLSELKEIVAALEPLDPPR